MERKIIREKYKKRNINKNNNKYEMIDVKRIITKDKNIHINIKYLNYIPMKNKAISKNNKNDYKLYKPSNYFDINLLAIKTNKGLKKKRIIDNKENKENNLFHKLSSIKEENKTDLIDLSDSNSKNSEENK